MTGAGPANAHKAQLWATNLDFARSRAQWNKQTVQLASGGEPVPWSELLRKFGKHNAHRTVASAAAQADLTVHLLLAKAALSSKFNPDSAYRAASPSSPAVYAPHILAADRPSAQSALDALEKAIAGGSGSNTDKVSAKIVRAHGLYALGRYEEALVATEGVELELPKDDKCEAYDLSLRVVGHSVKSLSLERLGRKDEAGERLLVAGRTYDEACERRLRSLDLREDIELHATGEEILFRLALWTHQNEPHPEAYASHRLYVLRSALWPAAFRPTKSLIVHRSFRSVMNATGKWSDATANDKAEESLIRRSTVLPRAGEFNSDYLAFLDEVAESWRRSGAGREGAQQVVETMYRALTHTFQSHRLLRHLSHALAVLGQHVEAGKALALYKELWDKSRETDATQVARELRHLHQRAEHESHGEKIASVEEENEKAAEVDQADEPSDVDSDRDFVLTLVFGSRVFTKHLDDPREGLSFARRAKVIFGEGKQMGLKEDAAVESKVERALGVALGALTAKEGNLDTRPSQQNQAREHLEKAVALDGSWTTLYALSYQLAELRQIAPALGYARQAVALPGAGIEAWHLLGLLVAAQKELNESLALLEAALDDDDDAGISLPPSGANTPPTSGALTASNSASLSPSSIGLGPSLQSNGHSTTDSLFRGGDGVYDEDSPRSLMDELVATIEIRMTKNVVIEALEGPEAALLDQQATMAFFSAAFAKLVAQEAPAEPSSSPPPATLSVPTGPLNEAGVRRSSSLLGRKRSLRKNKEPTLRSASGVALSVHSQGSTVHVAPSGSTSDVPAAAQNMVTPSQSNWSLADDATINGPSRGPPQVQTSPRATKLLVDLWLMSAASYRRAGKLEDAKGAIAEAEQLDPDSPDVWAQFALLDLPSSIESSRIGLMKALSFKADHAPSLVLLARLYLLLSTSDPSRLPFAEGLLDALTKRQGWDLAEAWFELSRCFKETGRLDRERECLKWALELERSRSVRPWTSVPRWL